MTFIITLIALIIERFFHWSHLRHWQWFTRYQHYITIRFLSWPNYLLLALCVLPLVILVGMVSCLINGWMFNIPKLIFGVIILLYCMGPNNLWVEIYSCIRALNQDDPHLAVEKVKKTFGIIAADQPQLFHQSFTRAIFIAANKRIFAVIFWFALFGPWAAILYRAVNLCGNATTSLGNAALQVEQILNWLPIRVFTFLFALVGHFTHVLARWKLYVKTGIQSNEVMLGECGIAAFHVAREDTLPEDGTAEKEALALLDRVFVMGLVILAVAMLVT
jgi:AmpE protein